MNKICIIQTFPTCIRLAQMCFDLTRKQEEKYMSHKYFPGEASRDRLLTTLGKMKKQRVDIQPAFSGGYFAFILHPDEEMSQ